MAAGSSRTKRTLDRNLIGSLAHGLAVLEAVGSHKEAVPLVTLASEVKLTKTSTWRLVHTLVRLGYVSQDPKTRSFRPAPRILSLGHAYFDGLDLRQLAAPFLQELSAWFNETVNLAVQDGDELIYVDRIGTSQIINVSLHIGSRLPLFNTSLGRALICEHPEEWLRGYMTRLATNRDAKEYLRGGKRPLPKLLDEARKQRYSLNDEELVKGLRSIASPVQEASGRIAGAIGIAVPSSRVSIAELKRDFVPQLLAATEKVSATLGYRRRR
jgi:IclR family transcriptional regulator, pca regulon regulatory protein